MTKPKKRTKTKRRAFVKPPAAAPAETPDPAKPKGKTAPTSRGHALIPWAIIRERYVTDERATVYGLADEFHVHPNVVGNRARDEGWSAQRRQWQADLSAEVRKRLIVDLADDIVDARRELLHATQALVRSGLHRYREDLEREESLETDHDAVAETEKFDAEAGDANKGKAPRGERVLTRSTARKLRRPDFKLLEKALGVLADMTAGKPPAQKQVEDGGDAGQDDFRID